MSVASAVVERVARESHGRLVGLIARETSDLAAAEDMLSAALLAALSHWPEHGVPNNPEAWLLTVARNRCRNAQRDARVAQAHAVTRDLLDGPPDPDEGNDPLLDLLFVCAHPAIDPAIHTPLMLQTVLGLDAERIAAAYMVPKATMAQRLVRAKHRIRAAHIPFRKIDAAERCARLPPVLAAIYAAFGQSWEGPADPLVDEAFFLADLLRKALPQEPEASGLLALMCYVEARRPARLGPDGAYVPLDQQDPTLWSRPLALRGEGMLYAASRQARPGRYQLEAAIQSHHMRPLWGKPVSPATIAELHDTLVATAPSIGAVLAQAAAHRAAGRDPAACLALINALDAARLKDHQPYWATRAALLSDAGRMAEAGAAYTRAIALTTAAPQRAFLTAARADIKQA